MQRYIDNIYPMLPFTQPTLLLLLRCHAQHSGIIDSTVSTIPSWVLLLPHPHASSISAYYSSEPQNTYTNTNTAKLLPTSTATTAAAVTFRPSSQPVIYRRSPCRSCFNIRNHSSCCCCCSRCASAHPLHLAPGRKRLNHIWGVLLGHLQALNAVRARTQTAHKRPQQHASREQEQEAHAGQTQGDCVSETERLH